MKQIKNFYIEWKKKSGHNFMSVIENFNDYINSYGGYSSILTSPYFILAFILNCLMFKSWISDGWVGNVKDIIPSIIGFSLSAYAILVSFGSYDFQKLISEKLDKEKEEAKQLDEKKEEANTMYKQINTAFIHYIVVQMLSLILALLADTLMTAPYGFLEISFSFFCNLVFVYSLMLGLAAVFTIFRVAKLYQEFINLSDSKN